MNRIAVAVLAMLGFIVSSCAEGGFEAASGSAIATGKTAEERALEREVKSLNQVSRDIVVRNTLQGAGVGAVGGCALGLLIGGDSDDCLRYAAIGGAAGAVGGNVVGQRAAAVNQELARQDAIIANLRGINQQLGGVQANLRTVVSSQNAEIGSLQRQLSSAQISRSAYDARVRAINANRAQVINGLAASERNVAESRAELVSLESQGSAPLTQSKREAASTQQRIANLRSSISLVPTN